MFLSFMQRLRQAWLLWVMLATAGRCCRSCNFLNRLRCCRPDHAQGGPGGGVQEPEGGLRAHEVNVSGGDESQPGAGDGRRRSRRGQQWQRRLGGDSNAGVTLTCLRLLEHGRSRAGTAGHVPQVLWAAVTAVRMVELCEQPLALACCDLGQPQPISANWRALGALNKVCHATWCKCACILAVSRAQSLQFQTVWCWGGTSVLLIM